MIRNEKKAAIRFKDFSWSGNSGHKFYAAVVDICRINDGPSPVELVKCLIGSASTYGVPKDSEEVILLEKWIEKQKTYINPSNINLFRGKMIDEISIYYKLLQKEYFNLGARKPSSYDDEIRYFNLLKSTPGVSFKRRSHPRDETNQEWVFHNWEDWSTTTG